MTSLAQTQTLALPEIAAMPTAIRKPRFNLSAWTDLFFGPGPLWSRTLRWAQRNALD